MTDPTFTQKWLEGARGKICYFVGQNFSGRPTVVFLHGLSANHTTLTQPARELQRLGFNCLLLDLRGHGHSDKTKKRDLYRFSVFSEDLKRIIAQENLSQIILVGYSFGGYIALDYATKNLSAVQALILISTNHINPLKYRRLNLLTWPAYGFLSLLAWLLLWQKRKHYFYFDQEKSRGYWDSTFIGLTTMPISINFWMLAEIARLDFSRDLEKITCPTLIIKSQADLLLSTNEARDMARKMKDCQLRVIPEKTHFLASRHKNEIIEAMVNFLKPLNL